MLESSLLSSYSSAQDHFRQSTGFRGTSGRSSSSSDLNAEPLVVADLFLLTGLVRVVAHGRSYTFRDIVGPSKPLEILAGPQARVPY